MLDLLKRLMKDAPSAEGFCEAPLLAPLTDPWDSNANADPAASVTAAVALATASTAPSAALAPAPVPMPDAKEAAPASPTHDGCCTAARVQPAPTPDAHNDLAPLRPPSSPGPGTLPDLPPPTRLAARCWLGASASTGCGGMEQEAGCATSPAPVPAELPPAPELCFQAGAPLGDTEVHTGAPLPLEPVPPAEPPGQESPAMQSERGDGGAGPQAPPMPSLALPRASQLPVPPEHADLREAGAADVTASPRSCEPIRELAEEDRQRPPSPMPPESAPQLESGGAGLQDTLCSQRTAREGTTAWFAHLSPPPNAALQAGRYMQVGEADDGGQGQVIHPASRAVWMPLGIDGQLQLCIRCEGSVYEPLLQQAENIAAAATGCDSGGLIEEEVDAWFVDSILQGHHSEWQGEVFMRATASSGMFAGMAAVGSGANPTTRGCAARLALALAVVMEFPQHFGEAFFAHHPPSLFQLFEDAQRGPVLLAAASGCMGPSPMPPPCVPFAFRRYARAEMLDRADSMWAAADRLGAVEGLTLHQQQNLYLASDPLLPLMRSARPVPPEMPDASDPRLAGVPEECLNDPFMELRLWDEINGPTWWPHCTLCNCWSNVEHLSSRTHLWRVQSQSSTAPAPEAPQVPRGPEARRRGRLEVGSSGQHVGAGRGRRGAGSGGAMGAMGASVAGDDEEAVLRPPLPRQALRRAARKERAAAVRQEQTLRKLVLEEELALAGPLLPKTAPPRPSPEDIFDWNYPWVDFEFTAVDMSRPDVVVV